MDRVREVLRLGKVSRIPGAKPPFRGLLSMRGEVVTLLDLVALETAASSGRRAGLAHDTTGVSTGTIRPHRVESVVVLRGGRDPLGLAVSGVEEIRDLVPLEPDAGPGAPGSPRNRAGLWAGAVRDGSAEIGVLDADRVLAAAEALSEGAVEPAPVEVGDRG